MKPLMRILVTIAVMVLLIISFYAITKTITSLTGYSITEYSEEEIGNLVECLNKKGVALYITDNCKYCEDQKELFEENVDELNIINCADEFELCAKKEILFTRVPTWEINGQLFYGKFDVKKLSRISGCKI